MNKRIILIILLMCSKTIFANIILDTDRAYTTGDINLLSQLYKQHSSNVFVNYTYAKAALTINIATYAENFIQHNPDGFMRNDLLHQLLIFYFNNNNYNNYITKFNLLPANITSLNEKCGYDYSLNITHNSNHAHLTNDIWLISNNIPNWCATLVMSRYPKFINQTQLNYMLYNLIRNNKLAIFNNLIPAIKMAPINFYHYNNTPLSRLPHNSNYKYLTVYRITSIGYKYTQSAYNELQYAHPDNVTEQFLNNYLAFQFAKNLDFEQSTDLYDKYDNEYLSNEEIEWRTRGYMYFSKWSKVIDSIENSPAELQQEEVWLYWRAVAYAKLNKISIAQELFKQISPGLSYYAMLAQGELNHTILIAPHAYHQNATNDAYTVQAQDALLLYQLGTTFKHKSLINIANAQWNYAVKHIDDNNLLRLSNMAQKYHFYPLSIAAANQLDDFDFMLSFPLSFLNIYNFYSTTYNIPQSYPLAITRQESRFNPLALAFDGGVGLMQLMPQTAKYVAKKSATKNCYRQSLSCNIKLGTWYLSQLYHAFNGNIIYSTAAYNAGPKRARRWQNKLSTLDNKVQMELIPISITRDYVQKVLTNQALYASILHHQSKINLLQYINQIVHNHYVATDSDLGTIDIPQIN